VQQGVQAITRNLGMIRALQFPRASLPISSTLTQFQNLLASTVVLIGIVLLTGQPVRWEWLLLVPVLILQTIFNIGLAMVMARIGNKITDLKQVLPFVMRTWMYASGVLYPATLFDKNLPGPLAHIALANPLVVYIEIARRALLVLPKKEMVLTWHSLTILAVGWAVVMGIGGFLYFWRGEQEYGRG
jgi:teichoic acid transport system permease protein